MSGRFRRPLRARPTAALAFAFALTSALGGCLGGSSEAGNPDITLEFRREGEPYAFSGILQISAADADPEFYYDHPDDGTTPPDLIFETGARAEPSPLWLAPGTGLTLKWKEISENLYRRQRLRLLKSAAGGLAKASTDPLPVLPDFNLILQATDGSSFTALVPTLRQGEKGYVSANGDSGTVFVVDLEPGSRVTGAVDTTGPAGRPLALFVPGTPYYALVHGDRFAFVGLPHGRFSLRWVAPDGRIFAGADSLVVEGDDSLSAPLRAGERRDSIPLPEPYPTLDAPAADPPGQFAFSDSVVVTLKAKDGAEIRYTLDGTTPGRSSPRYEKPLVLISSATLKSVAYAEGYNPSPISVNNYVLAPPAPLFSPGAGTFIDSVAIALSGPEGGAIHYTLDGSTPSANSTLYTGPIVLRSSTVVQAVVLIPGLGASAVVSGQYRIQSDTASGGSP